MVRHERWQILVAGLAGAVLVILPIAAVIALNAAGLLTASEYVWLLLVPIGIFSLVRMGMFISDNRRLDMLHKEGRHIEAKYLSHGCKTASGAGSVQLYYVRYSFEADGKSVLATSPSVYTWDEALAFRAAGKVNILYKSGIYTISDDPKALCEEYFNEIRGLKKSYNDAFNSVYRDLIEKSEKDKSADDAVVTDNNADVCDNADVDECADGVDLPDENKDMNLQEDECRKEADTGDGDPPSDLA